MYNQYQQMKHESRPPISLIMGSNLPLASTVFHSREMTTTKTPASSPMANFRSPSTISLSPLRGRRSANNIINSSPSSPHSSMDSLSSTTIIPGETNEPDNSPHHPHRPHASPGEESSTSIEMAEMGEEVMEGLCHFEPMQLSRAHWIQLHKTNMQIPVLRRTFLQLLQRHPPLRALWPFSRCFDGSAAKLDELIGSASLRHFCSSYQASLTLIMDNLDDEPALSRLLQELGSNHFFYDAIEPNFKMIREEFIRALGDCMEGTNDELNAEIEHDWEKLWAKIESNMAFGLAIQRHNYLAHCVTANEMEAVKRQWTAILQQRDVDSIRVGIAQRGTETFIEGMRCIGAEWRDSELEHKFAKASRDVLRAMEMAIELWEPGTGFLRLCAEIDGKCASADELIRRGSGASLTRKAFLEGLGGEIAAWTGEKEPTGSSTMHTWTKIYRVAEQAIIADGMANER